MLREPSEVQQGIEEFLDANNGFNSLADLYPLIGDLCREKAQHARETWQDEALAHLWERYAGACDKAAEAFEKAAKRID